MSGTIDVFDVTCKLCHRTALNPFFSVTKNGDICGTCKRNLRFSLQCSHALKHCYAWILRARDRDRDILARLRFGHQRPLNRRCPARLGHQRPVNRGCPRVSKPVSQDIQSICYCLHTGIFRLDTCDLVVAGVRISISPKYLYLYLALKLLTCYAGAPRNTWV